MELSVVIMVISLSLTVATGVLLLITPLVSWSAKQASQKKAQQRWEFDKYLNERRWILSHDLFLSRMKFVDFLESLYAHLSEQNKTLKSYLSSENDAPSRLFHSSLKAILAHANHASEVNRIKAYKILVLGDVDLNLNEFRYILRDFNSEETNLAYWSSKLLLSVDFEEYSEKIYNRLIQNKSPFSESLALSLLKPFTPSLIPSEGSVDPAPSNGVPITTS
jgi:hypothetical protein